MTAETVPGRGIQNMQTPDALYDWLDRQYNFVMDAAADEVNAKCGFWLTQEDDALTTDWVAEFDLIGRRRSVFVNPPFALSAQFAKKCAEEAAKGCLIVAVFNCSTGSKWFREHVHGVASEVLFLSGRVSFVEPDTGRPAKKNPRDTMIVIWDLGGRRRRTEYVLVDSKTFEEL